MEEENLPKNRFAQGLYFDDATSRREGQFNQKNSDWQSQASKKTDFSYDFHSEIENGRK